MSISVYPIPTTKYYIDEDYNLCDCEGYLYKKDGNTISFDEYLDIKNSRTLRRRQGYVETPPPVGEPNPAEMKPVWNDVSGSYYSWRYYLYKWNGQKYIPVSGNGSGTVKFCKTDMIQNMKRTVPTPNSCISKQFPDGMIRYIC